MRSTSLACLALFVGGSLVAVLPAPAQTVSLRRGGEQLTIEVGNAARLPADFPEDVFVPTDARLERVERTGDGRVLVELHVPTPPANLVDAYAASMAVSGWTAARVAPIAGGEAQAWEKDARAVVVAASGDAAGTRLRLQLLPRRGATTTAPR